MVGVQRMCQIRCWEYPFKIAALKLSGVELILSVGFSSTKRRKTETKQNYFLLDIIRAARRKRWANADWWRSIASEKKSIFRTEKVGNIRQHILSTRSPEASK